MIQFTSKNNCVRRLWRPLHTLTPQLGCVINAHNFPFSWASACVDIIPAQSEVQHVALHCEGAFGDRDLHLRSESA